MSMNQVDIRLIRLYLENFNIFTMFILIYVGGDTEAHRWEVFLGLGTFNRSVKDFV